MSDKLIIALLVSLSTLGITLSASPFKDSFRGDNIDISISISDDEVKFTTSYPKEKSKKVHAYLQGVLHLDELDMGRVDLDHYKMPDGLLATHIKSKNGYFLIRLDRRKNPVEMVEHIKRVCEGMKNVLAES